MKPNTGDELADYFATLLRVPRERISTTANVLDLGADSIMLVEARSWIEAEYGQRIDMRRFFEDLSTIEAIAAFLAEARAGAPAAAEPAPVVAAGPAALPPAPDGAGHARREIGLMRAQLALVAEVIEAQNRTAAALRRRFEPARPSTEQPATETTAA